MIVIGSDFDSYWLLTETLQESCVALNLSTKLWQAANCDKPLPYVCLQLPPEAGNIAFRERSDLVDVNVKLAMSLLAICQNNSRYSSFKLTVPNARVAARADFFLVRITNVWHLTKF